MQTFLQLSRFFGSRRLRPQSPKGFTLIELVTVVAIMVILTTVLLFSQKRFNSSTVLRSLTYGVALTIQQAQTYGTSVRSQAGGTCTNTGFCARSYGVSFSNADSTHYTLFADLDNDGTYVNSDDSNDIGEEVQVFTLGAGYTILKFCGVLSLGPPVTQICSSDPTPLRSMSIYFKRPNPDAKFTGYPTGAYVSAYIQIQSPGGDTRSITVYKTGEIAVGSLNT